MSWYNGIQGDTNENSLHSLSRLGRSRLPTSGWVLILKRQTHGGFVFYLYSHTRSPVNLVKFILTNFNILSTVWEVASCYKKGHTIKSTNRFQKDKNSNSNEIKTINMHSSYITYTGWKRNSSSARKPIQIFNLLQFAKDNIS